MAKATILIFKSQSLSSIALLLWSFLLYSQLQPGFAHKYWSVFQSYILLPFHLAGNKGTTCSNDSAATFIAPVIKGRSAQILPRAPAGLSSHNDHPASYPASRAIDFSDSFVSHSRLLCTPPRTEKGTRAGKDTKRKAGEEKNKQARGAGGRC